MAHVAAMRGASPGLVPDRDRLRRFLRGETPVGDGRFWLVNLLRFKPGGQEAYRRYVDHIEPLMRAVGGKPILDCPTARTIIDGAGAMPDWDAVFIGEYPSPKAFIKFSSTEEYAKGHQHRSDALAETQMIAIKGGWAATARASGSATVGVRRPNYSAKVPQGTKTGKKAEAIHGNPKKFLAYVKDKRFAKGPVWQLNLLAYEPNGGAELYAEYAARAQSKIATMKTSDGHAALDGSKGVQLYAQGVFALNGQDYDSFGVMAYPDRQQFTNFASGNPNMAVSRGSKASVPAPGSEEAEAQRRMADGFKFRQAGLAVQALVGLNPEGSVRDPAGPARFRARL